MRTVYLRREPASAFPLLQNDAKTLEVFIGKLPLDQQLDRLRELELVTPSKSLLKQLAGIFYPLSVLLENKVYLPIYAFLEQGGRFSNDDALRISRHCEETFSSRFQLMILQKLIPASYQLNHYISQFSLHPFLLTCPQHALHFLTVLADYSLLSDTEFLHCLDFAFQHIFEWQHDALLLLSIMLSDGRFFDRFAVQFSLIFDQLASVDRVVVSEAITCIQVFTANFDCDYHAEVERVINDNCLVRHLRNALPLCAGDLLLAVNVLETAVQAACMYEEQQMVLLDCSELFYYSLGEVAGIEDEEVWANFLDLYGNART